MSNRTLVGCCLTIQAFVAFTGIALCGQAALTTYNKSVLTSIEKRFSISSSMAGFIAGAFNIGNLLFVVVVSKLSSNHSRPRFIAFGSLIIAIGGLVNGSSHFIHGTYDPHTTNASATANLDCGVKNETSNNDHPYLYVVLIFGQILQGIGATVHIPLGSSYVDDFASTHNSPLYLGSLFVLQNFGSGTGYLMGSWTSNIYVDFEKVPAEYIPIKDERWIGAWWLGYLIISIFVVFTAIPLFFFPKSMKKQKESRRESELAVTFDTSKIDTGSTKDGTDAANRSHIPLLDDDVYDGKNPTVKTSKNEEAQPKLGVCKDFFVTILRLLSNPIYMLVVLSYSGLMFIVGSVSAFLPKYLEVTYRQTPSAANLMFGIAIPLVMTIGLFSGGLITKKFKWGTTAILRYIALLGFASPIIVISAWHMGCSYEDGVNSTVQALNGTSEQIQMELIEFDCDYKAKIFVGLMSIMTLLLSSTISPIYTVLLRIVNVEDKSTAIGVMFLFIRALGLIPAPIVTGKIIDSACVNWSKGCSENRNCLGYNIQAFRTNFNAMIVIGLMVSSLFSITALVVRWRQHEDKSKGLLCRVISSVQGKVRTTSKHEANATNV